MSLYMRGWDGKSKHPITEEDTPSTDTDLAEQTSNIMISEIKTSAHEYPEIYDYILNLPLIRLYNDEFIPSYEAEQGYTINDRLDIVIRKETTWSCVRVSSNWFLHTSYFYAKIIGIDYDIDIYNYYITG